MKRINGLLLWVVMFFSVLLKSQDLSNETKNWINYNINIDIGKNFKAGFTQLYSFDLPSYKLGFQQTDFSLSYKLLGVHWLHLEYSFSNYPWQSNFNELGLQKGLFDLGTFHRVNLFYNFSHPLSKKIPQLKLSHEIEAQVFFPSPEKHRARINYNTTLRYSNSKWPWRFSPYIGSSFYCYLGGRPVEYYDNEGNLIASNAPNGIHRFRLKTGFTVRPFKKQPISFTLYFIQQWEFNLPIPYTELNYKPQIDISQIQYPFNPSDFKTQQPFNNYFTFGLSITYRIKIKLPQKNVDDRNKERKTEDIDNL